METNSDTLEALKYYYGFDGFLDNQEEVVEEILSGRDLCVIMPTAPENRSATSCRSSCVRVTASWFRRSSR